MVGKIILIVILSILGVLGFLFFIIVLSRASEMKRIKVMKDFADENNLDFSVKNENIVNESNFSNFLAFNIGYWKVVKNILKGEYKGMNLILFDYHFRYGTSGPNTNSTHVSSTFAIVKTKKKIPDFILLKRNFFNNIQGFFNNKEIKINSSPKFSKKYHLRGESSNLKSFFSENVLNFLEKGDFNFQVESHDGYVLFHVGRRMKANSLKKYLDIIKEFMDIIDN